MVNTNKVTQTKLDTKRAVLKTRLHLLGRKHNLTEVVEEYVEESEHQDGLEYWNQFDTIEQVWEDVLVYKNNR
jgi:hypothetical protein